MKLDFFLFLDVDRSAISCFAKICISNSILNIEKGRHLKIPVEQRICPLCKQEIEDEYNFIMKWTSRSYLPSYIMYLSYNTITLHSFQGFI
jgi:hypothetical protein